MDIKLSEIFGTIWCVLVFSTNVFEKTATPDGLVLMFWLGALEFKILNLFFPCCSPVSTLAYLRIY